jgi:hypothetical protein
MQERAQGALGDGGACARCAAWHSWRQLVGDGDRARSSPRGLSRKGAHAWQGGPSDVTLEWTGDGEMEAHRHTEAFWQRAVVWRLKMGLGHFCTNVARL